jgi:hypothetical protein
MSWPGGHKERIMRFRILLAGTLLAASACGGTPPSPTIVLEIDGVVADSVGSDPSPCKRRILTLRVGMSETEIRRAFQQVKVCPP